MFSGWPTECWLKSVIVVAWGGCIWTCFLAYHKFNNDSSFIKIYQWPSIRNFLILIALLSVVNFTNKALTADNEELMRRHKNEMKFNIIFSKISYVSLILILSLVYMHIYFLLTNKDMHSNFSSCYIVLTITYDLTF